jgi:hypothetical protein
LPCGDIAAGGRGQTKKQRRDKVILDILKSLRVLAPKEATRDGTQSPLQEENLAQGQSQSQDHPSITNGAAERLPQSVRPLLQPLPRRPILGCQLIPPRPNSAGRSARNAHHRWFASSAGQQPPGVHRPPKSFQSRRSPAVTARPTRFRANRQKDDPAVKKKFGQSRPPRREDQLGRRSGRAVQ